MKALIKKKPVEISNWYTGLDLVDKPEPKLTQHRNVKIQIVSSGICGTDVSIYRGTTSLANAMHAIKTHDVIIGHEYCGRIYDLDESARPHVASLLLRRKPLSRGVASYLKGRTVETLARDSDLVDFLNKNFYATSEMHFTCHECLQCRIGHEHVCKNTIGKGLHENGAFTTFMTIPADRLILIEQGEIPPQIISFMDAVGNAVHTAQMADLVGKNVLITGAGVQGLASCAIAKLLGANKVLVTDVEPKQKTDQTIDKLDVARKLGATATFYVNTTEGQKSLAQTIKKETDHTGIDVVFEMSGSYGAYQQAFQSIRMGGTMLLLGLPSGNFEVDFSKDIVFKGLHIHGIYGRRVFDTWDLMRYLLAKGLTQKILDSGMITHQLPLERYDEGFQKLLNGQAIKVLLKP